MTDTWIPAVKPPADVCPEKFCFYWTEAGAFVTPLGKVYASVQDAFPDLIRVEQASCRLGPGHCSRHCIQRGEQDRYEGCDPELIAAGLPWFYFIASITNLKAEFHEQYIRESRDLWGDHDGTDGRLQF